MFRDEVDVTGVDTVTRWVVGIDYMASRCDRSETRPLDGSSKEVYRKRGLLGKRATEKRDTEKEGCKKEGRREKSPPLDGLSKLKTQQKT